MTLSKAGRIIQNEAEFLGKSWDWVMATIASHPWIFSPRVLEAHKTLTEA